MVLHRVLLLMAVLLLPAGAQDLSDLVRFHNIFRDRCVAPPCPANGQITTAQVSLPVFQVGQGGHLLLIRFPAAVADVSPIQVRLEASYTCPDPPPAGTCAMGTWFPISTDVTSVPFLGGAIAYALVKANGSFPHVRVNSLAATPGALGMEVNYTGAPYPIANVFLAGDRWIISGATSGYDKATFVICNGAACAVGTNLTNEYIVVQGLRPRVCYACAKTAPTGAALIVDINRNGTSIFTTPKLTIAAGSTCSTAVASASNFATTAALSPLDRLTIDIDQIGSGAAGQDVTVTCVLDF